MFISCESKSLETAKYSNKKIMFSQITECPICKASINPIVLNSIFYTDDYFAYFENHLFCANCNRSFIGTYSAPLEDRAIPKEPDLVSVEPQKCHEVKFDKHIAGLSPQFVKIYNQALAAETSGLDEIAGLGYRKSLEFLVKDFAIHKNPADEDKIKKLMLSPCIEKYIDNPQIKTLVKCSSWIGNDEAHYIRKQIDRDVNDMKSFIQATVYFIGMVLITEDAESMEPIK